MISLDSSDFLMLVNQVNCGMMSSRFVGFFQRDVNQSIFDTIVGFSSSSSSSSSSALSIPKNSMSSSIFMYPFSILPVHSPFKVSFTCTYLFQVLNSWSMMNYYQGSNLFSSSNGICTFNGVSSSKTLPLQD